MTCAFPLPVATRFTARWQRTSRRSSLEYFSSMATKTSRRSDEHYNTASRKTEINRNTPGILSDPDLVSRLATQRRSEY
jgi:hypothetical protein